MSLKKYSLKFFIIGILAITFNILLYSSSIKIYWGISASSYTSEADLFVHRFWSEQKQSHFYTSNPEERDRVITSFTDDVWNYESVAFQGFSNKHQSAFIRPVYRFWSEQKQSHFYTISDQEKDFVDTNYEDNVWKYEGISYLAATRSISSEFQPVYRFWSEQKQTHFYTASKSEKIQIEANFPKNIWKYEQIAYYVIPYSRAGKPTVVTGNCPAFNEKCVPCWADDPKCRIESGAASGFQGWACQNNNPGNIRYSDYRNNLIENYGGKPSCAERGSFMVFATPATGKQSLKAYIRAIADGAHSAYPECGECSIKYFFSKYAPAGDQNNPTSYSNNVARRIGVEPEKTTLNWVVTNRLDEFVEAIRVQEGWFTN